jgi:teichuronic acid biosynthesis glycosyltransferase TuaC
MRVAFLVTGYPTGNGNTEGVFHRSLAEALVRAGVDVNVIAPVARVPWGFAAIRRKYSDYERIPRFYRLGGVAIWRPRYWQHSWLNALHVRHRAFLRCLTRWRLDPVDVIHAHFAYPCGVAAVEARDSSKVPVVLTLHGSDVNVFPQGNGRARRLFAKAVRGADLVTAVSNELADRTEHLTTRRPAVQPIGIDLRPYAPPPDKHEARSALGIDPGARVVLFVGALVASKGVEVLLDALQLLGRRDIVSVFVGEGALRPVIREQQGSAVCVGAIPHERVPTYMHAADVLVLPSFSEGMPTVLIEAGAARLPIVAAEVGGIKELLADDRGRQIPAGDSRALADALEEVLVNPEGALRRADRLLEHVRRSYDVDETARVMIRKYESLAP